MINEQLLSGDDMDIKVKQGILSGITIMLVGRESGISVQLSERQAKALHSQLARKFEEVSA